MKNLAPDFLAKAGGSQILKTVDYLLMALRGERPLYPSRELEGGLIVVDRDSFKSGLINRIEARNFVERFGENDMATCAAYVGSFKKKGYEKGSTLPATIYPVTVELLLKRNGQVLTTTSQPRIQKALLSMNPGEVGSNQKLAISTIAEFDAYVRKHPWKGESPDELFEYIKEMSLELCVDFFEENPNYEYSSEINLTPADNSISRSLENVYGDILEGSMGTKDIPLFSTLLSQKASSKEENGLLENEMFASRLGHMSPKFGLADAQRHALTNTLNMSPGEVLALNGPPGTGKTTMLQSVVASLFVKAATEGDQSPPIIICCSTNNQAVTNVLDSFCAVEEKEVSPFRGRWIKGATSYGTYLKTGETNGFFSLESLDELEKSNEIETVDHFLKCFREAFKWSDTTDINQAVEIMSGSLKKGRAILEDIEHKIQTFAISSERVSQLQSSTGMSIAEVIDSQRRRSTLMRDSLEDYQLAQKEWGLHDLKMRKSIFGRYISAPEESKEVFGSLVEKYNLNEFRDLVTTEVHNNGNSYFTSIIEAIEKEILEADSFIAESTQLQASLIDAKRDLIEFAKRSKLENPEDIEISRLDLIADTTIRQPLFKLATHYWEGRWIQEMKSTIWAGRQDKSYFGKPVSERELSRIFARRSMITPCFVSTFHSLPKNLSFKNRVESGLAYNFADYLIVDEAGQVTPEVGATGFAFAKRALVVGDSKQIEPVWTCTESTDFYMAKEAGLVSEENPEKFAEFKNLGGAVSSGSLMLMAQQKSCVNSDLELSPGMHLYEHRRGYDNLIAFCNELCYKNKLIPKRGNPSPNSTKLPIIGYADIPGKSEIVKGGSRMNSLEAKMIAQWISKELPTLIAEKKKAAQEIIGIVTPFKAQSVEIKRQIADAITKNIDPIKEAYKNAGLNPSDALSDCQSITSGTTHALQGAERSVVIFSPVYSKHDKTDEYFFDASPSMLNVAVSRAKDSFIVFGDKAIFSKKTGTPSALLYRYMTAGENSEIVIPIEDLLREDMGGTSAKKAPEFISTLDGHRDALRKSFDLAQSELTIVSPWVTRSVLNDDGVLDGIKRASERGVRVSLFIGEEMNLENYSHEEFQDILNEIRLAGAKLTLVNKMHQKVIYIDDDSMVAGSFNWLSSSRSEKFKLMEKSIVYCSDLVKEERESDLRVLNSLKAEDQWEGPATQTGKRLEKIQKVSAG